MSEREQRSRRARGGRAASPSAPCANDDEPGASRGSFASASWSSAGERHERVLEILAVPVCCAQFVGRAARDDPAARDDHDAVAQRRHLLHDVARKEHAAALAAEAADDRRAPRACSSRRGRWSARRAARCAGRGPARAPAPPWSARRARSPPCGDRRSPHVQQLRAARRCALSSAAPERPWSSPKYCDVLARGEPRIEARPSGSTPSRACASCGVGHRVDSSTWIAPGVRPHQRVEHPQRRRLAGAVRAEQARDRAVARDEAHAVDRGHRAEALVQVFDANHGVAPLRAGGIRPGRREEERRPLDRRDAARSSPSASRAREFLISRCRIPCRRRRGPCRDDDVPGFGELRHDGLAPRGRRHRIECRPTAPARARPMRPARSSAWRTLPFGQNSHAFIRASNRCVPKSCPSPHGRSAPA